MARVKLPPVDQAKVLIGELNTEELESVITYARWILSQKKASEKKSGPPAQRTLTEAH